MRTQPATEGVVVRTQLACAIACLCCAAAVRAQKPELPSSDDDQLAPDTAPAPSKAELAEALARYAHEPPVEQVVQAALLAAPASRADALASRARSAAWIPRLGVRARRGQTIDLSGPQALDTEAVRVRANDALTLEASLNFDLERLLFRREEVALLHQSQAERLGRERMVREVIGLYFERRQLQVARDLKRAPSLEQSVRIAEIEALLDAFTNGAFRRMIAKTRWTTAASTAASRSH
jgi:hypothetical protein